MTDPTNPRALQWNSSPSAKAKSAVQRSVTQLLDELALAAQDIEAALGGKLDATAAQVLGNLLRAVRTSERVVSEGWRSLQK